MDSNYSVLLQQARIVFQQEIEQGDIGWRMTRVSTLSDLILTALKVYSLKPTRNNFTKLFNLCIKFLIIRQFGELKVHLLSSHQLLYDLNQLHHHLLSDYDEVVLQLDFDINYNSSLIDEQSYLKTISALDLPNIPNENVHHIINLILKNQQAKNG